MDKDKTSTSCLSHDAFASDLAASKLCCALETCENVCRRPRSAVQPCADRAAGQALSLRDSASEEQASYAVVRRRLPQCSTPRQGYREAVQMHAGRLRQKDMVHGVTVFEAAVRAEAMQVLARADC